ncbi:hypothetical protein [Streptomyces werraensis]
MIQRDFRPGSPERPTQEDDCWAAFWRIIGEEAYRIWLARQNDFGDTD